MKKIIFLIFAVFLLQSCMKIDTNITIDESGNATTSSHIDITALNSMQKSMNKSVNMNVSVGGKEVTPTTKTTSPIKTTDLCDQKKQTNLENSKFTYTNKICTKVDDNNFILTANIDLNKTKSIFNYSSGIYIIDIKELLGNNSNSGTSTAKVKTKEEQEKEMQMMVGLGFSYNISFELPGKILKSDIGTFSGNTLKIDLTKYIPNPDEKHLYVYSLKDGFNLTEGDLNKIIEDNKNQELKSELTGKYSKQLILIKNKFKKLKKDKSLKQIDDVLNKISLDKQKQIFDKIQKLKNKSDIIQYLESKIYMNL